MTGLPHLRTVEVVEKLIETEVVNTLTYYWKKKKLIDKLLFAELHEFPQYKTISPLFNSLNVNNFFFVHTYMLPAHAHIIIF